MRFRSVLALATVLAVLPALEGEALADERAECANAFEATQRLQQEGKLMSALDQANRCAKATCPKLLKGECSKWVSEITPKLPTIVVRVKTADGCERTDAKVEVSGVSKRGTENDADEIRVDPGSHDITATDPVSGKTKTTSINFAAGEHRDVDIDFAEPDAVCGKSKKKSASAKKIQLPTILLGAGGAAFLTTGLVVGLIGSSKRSDLDECKPNCPQVNLDHVQGFFTAGDVLGVIGLVGIGAAVASYFILQPKAAKPVEPKEKDDDKERDKETSEAWLRPVIGPRGFSLVF